jgi:ABC-2 type transport system ATP-binding protein
VLVAQALVHKPPVIILDEPTAGVDVELRQGLWRFVQELNQAGHTVVLTTHYLEEAEALCSRIAMLKHGRIVALDTTRNLLSGVAGVRLRLRVAPVGLPATLAATVVERDGNSHTLALESYAQIEGVLSQLRTENIEVQEMEVLQADLEDVFVQMMRRT